MEENEEIETINFEDDLLELYAISSEIMRTGTQEERIRERPIYEMLQRAVAERIRDNNNNYQKEKAENSISKRDIINYALKFGGIAVPSILAIVGFRESKKQFYTTLFYNMEYGSIQANQAIRVTEEVKKFYKDNLNSAKNYFRNI